MKSFKALESNYIHVFIIAPKNSIVSISSSPQRVTARESAESEGLFARTIVSLNSINNDAPLIVKIPLGELPTYKKSMKCT